MSTASLAIFMIINLKTDILIRVYIKNLYVKVFKISWSFSIDVQLSSVLWSAYTTVNFGSIESSDFKKSVPKWIIVALP